MLVKYAQGVRVKEEDLIIGNLDGKGPLTRRAYD
jgi:hypothetical protein